MITQLEVSNYRSLAENVRVRLDELTVLVGPNGSGKSNVVDALRFVADAMQMGLSGAITHRGGIAAVRRWSAGHPHNVVLRVELATEGLAASYAFELTGDRAEEYKVKREEARIGSGNQHHHFCIEQGVWLDGPEGLRPRVTQLELALPVIGGDERFEPLFRSLSDMTIYSIFPDTLRAPQKYSPLKPMSLHGDNWVSILKDQPSEKWKPDLVAALTKLTGDIEDIKVTAAATYLVAQFRHQSATRVQKWFDASQESDGTLRFAGIVTALLQEPPLPLIGIEEPELTVHPGALPLLFDHLSQACRRSQVVITTHSPELLDLVDVDHVRVVGREQGMTEVQRMRPEHRSAVRDGLLTLGDLIRSGGLSYQRELPLED